MFEYHKEYIDANDMLTIRRQNLNVDLVKMVYVYRFLASKGTNFYVNA